MPVSKRRRQARRVPAGPRQPTRVRVRRPWRRRLGWPLCIAGGLLFLLGNIGARTGIVFLPFDPHHVIAQFGGALLGVLGLIWATSPPNGRGKR